MPRSYRLLISVIVVVIVLILRFVIFDKDSTPRGPYFGQTPPDSTPQIFAPGFISQQFSERDAAFTPDGQEFYYSLWTGSFAVILFSKQVDGQWSEAEFVPFSSGHSDIEPFITPDGSRLYFASNRPVDGEDSKDYDIWFVERNGENWGEAQRLDSTINSPANEFYPTLTRDGTLYFTAQRADGFGGEDIYRSEFRDGAFQPPENIGHAINSPRGEFNALVAPDESFLIFSSFGRQDSFGGGDLYISFHTNGEWQPAFNLGERFNSSRLDYCPALSPDGQFFFFSSRKSDVTLNPETDDVKNIQHQLASFGNGNDDIYWVNRDFIQTLQKTSQNSAQ
jgi:Tol biopolymer transport system component